MINDLEDITRDVRIGQCSFCKREYDVGSLILFGIDHGDGRIQCRDCVRNWRSSPSTLLERI